MYKPYPGQIRHEWSKASVGNPSLAFAAAHTMSLNSNIDPSLTSEPLIKDDQVLSLLTEMGNHREASRFHATNVTSASTSSAAQDQASASAQAANGKRKRAADDDSTPGRARRSLTNPPCDGDENKPIVGSDEWHKMRRDNHKEVERRRRETINEGISELSKIVPGCDKNKSQILAQAVNYIRQLKKNEEEYIQKWTLEKLMTNQAIEEVTAANEKLKTECERAWREADAWKRACESGKPYVPVDGGNGSAGAKIQ
ncbi:Transcriptional regulator CBF1 [Neolecta irregularis DAH-3]|uniref:Transcriptional regulator CBF1 n=1 Tax=Neolecta irregularis (strain DAH-3) TaxID=1198029 RepID=A0A1U7LW98_NEOID|nr:Transcriptional regulator CBF1 [Neolecta irregularis DAH-3]|eukprot:OLL26956.1 Transcriptional regulator CBF1 [Neolecta irregularis DAH-3]